MDEFVGLTVFGLFHPDEAGYMLNQYNKVVKEHKSSFEEHRLKAKNGSYVWLEARGNAYRLHHDSGLRILIVARNITERKTIEYEKNKRIVDQLIAEQKINYLLKEKHRLDMDLKNRELATSAIYITQKNKILAMVKKEITHFMQDHQKFMTKRDFVKILKSIDDSVQFDNDWHSIKIHFEKIHPEFFETLRKRYKNLTPGDHKLCSLLKMNLKTKEIAQILKITPESTEIARIRLRKKLKLPKSTNLTQFIADI